MKAEDFTRKSTEEQIACFDQWCSAEWGVPNRSSKQLFDSEVRRISDVWDFDRLTPPLKVHIAEKLILESVGHIGSVADSGDAGWFILNLGRTLRGRVPGFDVRRFQPFKAALLLVAISEFSAMLPPDRSDCEHIRAGGGAMASTYLLALLESLFRMHSRYLNNDGTISRNIPDQLRTKVHLTSYEPCKRVNQIQQAFRLYLYRNRSELAERLRLLDRKLNIAKRLKCMRNPAMHGEWGDPGVEATFLALMSAMFYYSEGVDKAPMTDEQEPNR